MTDRTEFTEALIALRDTVNAAIVFTWDEKMGRARVMRVIARQLRLVEESR